jgi:mediator of RNA polymerase II transcription subunit 5
MPYIDTSTPVDISAQKWKAALKTALLKRISANGMENVFGDLRTRFWIPGPQIAKILLSFRARDAGGDDSLIFNYARQLLRLRLVSAPGLLLALFNTCTLAAKPLPEGLGTSSTGMPLCEERLFTIITQSFLSGDCDLKSSELHQLAFVITKWIQAITRYETSKQLEAGALHSIEAFTFGAYEAVASLAITIFSNPGFRQVMQQPWWKKRMDVIVEEVRNFDSHVLLWMRSQLAGRLQAITTLPPFIKINAEGRPVFSDDQILASVTDLPISNTRAGLFIWLNACLAARPMCDDLSMMSHLQARFPGSSQSLPVDLLIASFDVLTNALLRKEPEAQLHLIRSFICNKVPHSLSIIASMVTSAISIEACVSMAFMAISMEALPPISAGANEVRERLKRTRLEFLQACHLHGLVSEATIASVIQEQVPLPRVTKYTKEGLLAQCNNNIGRLEPLVDELDGMSGNAGAISGCFVDTINNLCMTRDTMSLKAVCSMLVRKPSSLDIILQYTQPAHLVLPLCNQLNGWIHDQDQTEFTPAYEEFAAILLLVLVAVHRYALKSADIGLLDKDNFISRLLSELALSTPANELSEDQNKQLNKWIEGLFATDESGEAGGISDEVMRNCPPQNFYQLVPTLFDLTIVARKCDALSAKTLNGGLEFLVEPFLLPSLVSGLMWLVQHSWKDQGDVNILLQVLDKLLKPSSSSPETKAMHGAILRIVAGPLYNSLQVLHQRQPDKKQATTLMNVLKPHLHQGRCMDANKAELTDWANSAEGGVEARLRASIRDLVTWVSDIGPAPPPSYTHRLFASACFLVGVNRARDAIIAELKAQTAIGNGAQALDICSALICAPLASSSKLGAATVRDSLRLLASDVQGLLHRSGSDSEAIVRLSRRVEAQMAVSQMPQMAMALPMPDQQAADQVMAELGLTDDALAATAANISMDPVSALDATGGNDFSNDTLKSVLDQAMEVDNASVQGMAGLNAGSSSMATDAQNIFGELGLDLTQDPQQLLNAQGGDLGMGGDSAQNAEDDIFAGLNLDDDFNFS